LRYTSGGVEEEAGVGVRVGEFDEGVVLGFEPEEGVVAEDDVCAEIC
jgi:hypothetical protein